MKWWRVCCVLLIVNVLSFTVPSLVFSRLYRYIDTEGIINYVPSFNDVPVHYQSQIQSDEESRYPIYDLNTEISSQVVKLNDPLTVELANGLHVKYLGLEIPDGLPRQFYQDVKAFCENVQDFPEITLRFDQLQRDKNGMLLAYFFAEDYFINARIIEQGYARLQAKPGLVRYLSELMRAQRSAKSAHLGMWAYKESGNTKIAPVYTKHRNMDETTVVLDEAKRIFHKPGCPLGPTLPRTSIQNALREEYEPCKACFPQSEIESNEEN